MSAAVGGDTDLLSALPVRLFLVGERWALSLPRFLIVVSSLSQSVSHCCCHYFVLSQTGASERRCRTLSLSFAKARVHNGVTGHPLVFFI